MRKFAMETTVGIFVLMGLVLIGYMTVKLGHVTFFGDDSYSLYARFTSVSGLRTGNPVKMLGMEIGRVQSLTIDQEDLKAVVELRVKNGIKVYDDAIASIEQIFKNDIEACRVAAIIIEPVQGEGGFNVAPPELMQRLRTMCDQHGILLICDEVQTGAGRTGTWFACEQSGIAPDLITMAKSMAGGFPISAVVGRAEVMDAPAAGGLGGTYAGSPMACAAALAVFDEFEKHDLLQRSRDVGQRITASLQALAKRHSCIADVRGLGAMVAMELCRNGDPHQPDAELTKALASEATKRGLIILTCGTYGNVVRILVPLTASNALLDEGLAIIDACLDALTAVV